MESTTENDQESLPYYARSTPNLAVNVEGRSLEILPGSLYQHYLLPLDYMPSRDLRPRWGRSRPPHEGISQLFRRDENIYREILSELQALQPHFAAIPRDQTPDQTQPYWLGGAMTCMDFAFTYFFVAKYRPNVYLEIGSGTSTLFARRAVTDHGLATKVVSIDPEPRTAVDAVCDHIVREGLETLPSLEIFEQLEPGDIVFMDGSHRAFMNSDVTVFMLDVLPRLKPGVIIHIHDIHLPYDYDKSFQHWYWNEQYMVATYLLAAPEKVKILLPSLYVHVSPELSQMITPPPCYADLVEHFRIGGSLWFTKA